MEHVAAEQLGTRLAALVEHRGEHVDEPQVRIGRGQGLQTLVQLPRDLHILGPARARLGGDEGDIRLRQLLLDQRDELQVLGVNLVHGFSAGQVVVALVDQDQSRIVRSHDAIEIVQQVAHVRTAEAAIHHGIVREVRRQRGPHPNARGADEQHRVLRRRRGQVRAFERLDVGLEAGRVLPPDRSERQHQERCREPYHQSRCDAKPAVNLHTMCLSGHDRTSSWCAGICCLHPAVTSATCSYSIIQSPASRVNRNRGDIDKEDSHR